MKAALWFVVVGASALAGCGGTSPPPLTVFAAASMAGPLDRVLDRFAKVDHGSARAAYAASSTLARQIERGAPADLFVSADERWMDWLQKKGRIVVGSRIDLLRNSLVLVAPRGAGFAVTLAKGGDLPRAFAGRLAIADPGQVPAGIYAKQALESLGFWSRLKGRLAVASDVRAALAFVGRGECAAGIVYGSDAAVSSRVTVVGRFDAASHDPIVYPAAIVKGKRTMRAMRLLQFLTSPLAQIEFQKAGFRTPAPRPGAGSRR